MNQFWNSSLSNTVQSSQRLVELQRRQDDFAKWIEAYEDQRPTSSNQGSSCVAFQRWFKFKEAFSPKFVTDTLASLPYGVDRCLDPFGGSGTTALTCRMLGISSVTTEVNPFLADLIAAKLTPIDADKFEKQTNRVIDSLAINEVDRVLPPSHPLTMTEPGTNGRYIFSRDAYATIGALLRNARSLPMDHQRLFRVLLGSVLIENSNVLVNGKGRRYRSNWRQRQKNGSDVLLSFSTAVSNAVEDIRRFSKLPKGNHRVVGGDARKELSLVRKADIAIFSPPYPNSFDYTDVYNVELWMLGYFDNRQDNQLLRQATLRSHVQTKWQSGKNPSLSVQKLEDLVCELRERSDRLWDKNIPQMIKHYFEDMHRIFKHLARILPVGHHAVVAVGDSRYAGVLVDVAEILPEVAHMAGFEVESIDEIRSMRSSAQHGGSLDLAEHCMVFRRTDRVLTGRVDGK